MKKKNLILASVLTLVVVGTFALAQTDMLQGRFASWRTDFSKIYLYKNRFVTLVVSPVTSVETSEVTSDVVSDVTSTVGSSKVTSKVSSKVSSEVASTVTTPVASAVAVAADIAEKAKTKNIKALTKTILESAAKADFKVNPSKYVLTSVQVKQILDLYEKGQTK